MNGNVRAYIVVAVAVISVVIFCLSTSVGQNRKPYEVPAQVYGVSAPRSDADHALDAYERLMQHYADLTERNMAGIATDLGALARRLDAIDAKLTALDARMARIEQHIAPASASATSPVSQGDQTPKTAGQTPISPGTRCVTPVSATPPVPAPVAGTPSKAVE